MNVLFLTLMEINDFSQTGIYPDLINEFAKNGHDIYVVSPCEEKNKNKYQLLREKEHVHLVSALIPDYFGVGLIQKGYASLVIGKRYIDAINKAIPTVKFNLILYSTPPITFVSVIEKIKKRDNAYAYLLLKDIWPQGPIDIGALSETGVKGLVTRYFKRKEQKLYEISDFIGCMSENNREYLIEKSGVDKNKIEICPNSIKVRNRPKFDKDEIRRSNGLPTDKTIFVYGGNLGVAQGIDFIISCLEKNEDNKGSFILIVGSGTEYNRLAQWFEKNNPHNSKLISHLPKEEYMKVMAACDVGLIFLDHRFTIPNFPSRLLSYMEGKMPVLAATDPNTDVGTVIEEGEFGYWCESIDTERFCELMKKLTNSDKLDAMGKKAFQYLYENYSIEKTYNIIVKHLNYLE